MTRTFRTLLLSAVAVGALATVAMATPPASMTSADTTINMHTPAGTAGMHPIAAAQMHTASGSMAAMHATMMADPAAHVAMLDDPTMQAHMAAYGVDADQMHRLHEAGGSVDGMLETLAAQGIDLDAMAADCPMLTNDAMAAMHGNGGLRSSGHHGAPTR